jgi:hypothetical protein
LTKVRDWTVVGALPEARSLPSGGEEICKRLVGATIIRIGGVAEPGIEGGGLIIDYRLPGSTQTSRVLFAFNELGMWVEAEGRL